MIGPLLWVDDVCEAVEATLRTWLPSVLTEMHAVGKPLLPQPVNWEQLPDENASTSAEYPTVIIASTGMGAPPINNGDGTIDLTWQIIVSAIVRGESYAETAKNTRCYTEALAVAVVQHGSLDGLAESSTLTDTSFRLARDSAARTLGFGHVAFDVVVRASIDSSAGPAQPPPDGETSPDDPTVIDTPVTLAREP